MAAPKKTRPRSGNPARKRVASKPTVVAPPPPPPLPVDDGRAIPPDGAAYPQVLRGESYVWWRSLLGAVFGLLLYLTLSTVVSQMAVFIVWAVAAADHPYREFVAQSFAFERPSGLLASLLGVIVLIPIAMALMGVVHGVRSGWLLSVQAKLRWRYLLITLAVALVALLGVSLLSSLTQPLHLAPQPGYIGYLVVIVLVSPVQAAAEEIFFRGYLMQSLGSLVAKPWFGVVVSSVVFALLHGTQNLPLFVNRLAFGLIAGVLVWKTGGLEAGIAVHIANNVLSFGIAALTSSVAALKAITEIGWVTSASNVAGFAVCAVLAYGLSRLMKLRTRVDLAADTPSVGAPR